MNFNRNKHKCYKNQRSYYITNTFKNIQKGFQNSD